MKHALPALIGLFACLISPPLASAQERPFPPRPVTLPQVNANLLWAQASDFMIDPRFLDPATIEELTGATLDPSQPLSGSYVTGGWRMVQLQQYRWPVESDVNRQRYATFTVEKLAHPDGSTRIIVDPVMGSPPFAAGFVMVDARQSELIAPHAPVNSGPTSYINWSWWRCDSVGVGREIEAIGDLSGMRLTLETTLSSNIGGWSGGNEHRPVAVVSEYWRTTAPSRTHLSHYPQRGLRLHQGGVAELLCRTGERPSANTCSLVSSTPALGDAYLEAMEMLKAVEFTEPPGVTAPPLTAKVMVEFGSPPRASCLARAGS